MGGGRVEGLARRDEVHCSPATPLVRPATIDKEAAIVGCTGANIDCSRVEMSCSVDEIGCKPAIVLIIVKTLKCTRVIKGFYYDEKLCKLSEKLVDPAKTLEPGRIALEPRLEPDAGGREAFRAQHENTARPAAGTITPDPDVLCRWLPGPAQTKKPEPAPTPDCKPP